MKIGRSLNELAAEITRQAESKRDFIASTEQVEMQPTGDGDVVVEIGDKGTFPVGDIAHGQIATHTGIPAKYYDRMRQEAPELLADNVNAWYHPKPGGKPAQVRMWRTMDKKLRANLSDKYQAFEDRKSVV